MQPPPEHGGEGWDGGSVPGATVPEGCPAAEGAADDGGAAGEADDDSVGAVPGAEHAETLSTADSVITFQRLLLKSPTVPA